MFEACVVTVSDKSYSGEREDLGGPLVADILRTGGYNVTGVSVVPDERDMIRDKIIELSERGARLIVTTGGTGFSKRDVTPEATMDACPRLVPGIAEAMRYASMKITPKGMLSRAAAGLLNNTLVINLPGSPKAAKECLEAVLPALLHGIEILVGSAGDCAEPIKDGSDAR